MNIQGGFPLRLTGLISWQSKELSRVLSNLKASLLWCSTFFMIHLSNPYMTTGKTMTIWTFVGKVMSLLFNTLSRFIIAFLPRTTSFNCMTAVTIHSDFEGQENKSVMASTFPPFYLLLRDGAGCDDLSFYSV